MTDATTPATPSAPVAPPVTAASAAPARRRPLLFWGFIVLMLALTVLFALLGKWQLDRLAWKEGLIAQVAERMHLPPITLPQVGEWADFDPETYQYRQVTLTGHFINDQAVRVFVGLSDAKGRFDGPGDWIMTPFALDSGGTVFVDRGFVPEQMAGTYTNDKAAPTGTVTITGLAMPTEEAGPFTPGPNAASRLDWVRNTVRLGHMLSPKLMPVAPVYVDLPAGPAGALPQGGETTVEFPNNHLGYAWTWFGFAIITPIMLVVWIWRQRRRTRKPATA